MKKLFFLGIMLMTGLTTACKDENVFELVDSEQNVNVEDVVYGIRLTDALGNDVTSLGGDFTILYAEVEAQGNWILSTENSNFVYLTSLNGKGNGRVPVFVSTCWAGSRKFSIEATPRSYYLTHGASAPASRAGENPTVTTDDVEQTQPTSLSAVADRLSSNLGAGFSLSFVGSDNLLLTTQMPLFKLRTANMKQYIVDDLTPSTYQSYIETNSRKALRDQVSVGVNGNISSGSLAGSGIDVDVWVGDNEDGSAYYAVRRQITTFFTREIYYSDAMADDLLAPGFKMMRDSLENRLLGLMNLSVPAASRADEKNPWWRSANDSLQAVRYVDEFIREVGPNFINKASMGCALDYYIKVDTSKIEKGVSVKAVLDVKYNSQVKDSTQVIDSTAFGGHVDVGVLNKAQMAASSTEVEVVISGGNTQLIDILCNGGSLDVSQVQQWQQSISPETSVMIDMEVVPISALFNRMEVKSFIYERLVTLGLTQKSQNGSASKPKTE